ncbi:hypothetical protein Esti_004623 [Eimeria stiedai]
MLCYPRVPSRGSVPSKDSAGPYPEFSMPAPLGPLSEMGNPRPWLFVGSRGVPVSCYSWDVEKPRAVVVLVHGQGSHCMYEWMSSSAAAASEAGVGSEAGVALAGKLQQLPLLPRQQQQEDAHEEVKSSWNCCRPSVVKGEKQQSPHMGRSPSISSSAPGAEGGAPLLTSAWSGSVRAGNATSFSSVNSFSPLHDTDVAALFASAAPSMRSGGSNVPSRAPSVSSLNFVEAPAAQLEAPFSGSRPLGQEKPGLQYYGSWVHRFVSQGLQVVGIDLTQSAANGGNPKDKSQGEAFDQIAEDVRTLLQSLANDAPLPIFLFGASTAAPVAVRAAELLAKAGLLGRPQLAEAPQKQQQGQKEQQQQEQQQNGGKAEGARGEEATCETGSVASNSTAQASPVAAAALAMGGSHRVIRQRPVPLSGLILLSPVLDKVANVGKAAGGCSLTPWWKSMISLMPRCGIGSQAGDLNSPWGFNLEAGIRAAKADAHWLRRPILREATKPLSISDWARLFYRQMQEEEARNRLQQHIRGGEKAAKESPSELLVEATRRQQDVLFMRHEEAPQAQHISVLIVQSLDDTTTPPLEAVRFYERLGGRAALPEPWADVLKQERNQQRQALLAAAAKQQEQQELEIEKAVVWQTEIAATGEGHEEEETDTEATASSVTELEQTREAEPQEALDAAGLRMPAGVEADPSSTTCSLPSGSRAVEGAEAPSATAEVLPLAERMRLAGEGAKTPAGGPAARSAEEEAAPSVSARSESLLADEEVPWERGSEQGTGTAAPTLASSVSAAAAAGEAGETRGAKVQQNAGWSGLCSCTSGEVKREAEPKATEGAKKLRRRPKKKAASRTTGGWLQGGNWWSCSGQQQEQQQKRQDSEALLFEKKKGWGAVEGLVFDEHGWPVDVRAAHACMQEVRLSGFEPPPQIVRYLSKAAIAELEECGVPETSRVPGEGWQRGTTAVWQEETEGLVSRVISEAEGGALQLWVLRGRTHMLTKEAGSDTLQADILSRFVEPALRRLAGDGPSSQPTRETTAH